MANRLGAIESNSSKKSTQGFAALARSNSSRTYISIENESNFILRDTQLPTDCSLAPIYLFKISGPLTLMKFSPHSLATADASKVLPQPGKP